MVNLRLLPTILTLALATAPVQARYRPFVDEMERPNSFEEGTETTQEDKPVLPEGYNDEDLQEFSLGQNEQRFRYFIERGSLHSEPNGITRFLLVIRSPQGADNISYEGLHCGEHLYKVYAYGVKQSLKPIPKPVWKDISRQTRDNYHNTLYNNLLCDLNTGKANPPDKVFRAMQTSSTVRQPFINQ